MKLVKGLLASFAIASGAGIAGASANTAVEGAPATGSTAFCLYELPNDGNGGRRKWINLGIVQFVEVGRSEVIVYYGGGNFGSGHEVRIPAGSPQEVQAVLRKMAERARSCS